MTKTAFNPPIGLMPALQYAPPDMLAIDAKYQRSIESRASQRLIANIAKNWDWSLCMPLVVARRPEQVQFFVIDGQHRLAAAKLRGDIQQLPCVILNYPTAESEAADFVALNTRRAPLNALDIFRAALASGDAEAAAIMAMIDAAGLVVARHNNTATWKPGWISHIPGIATAQKMHGDRVVRPALSILAQAWPDQVLHRAGTLWPGIVAIVAQEVASCVDEDDSAHLWPLVADMLGTQTQSHWATAITRYGADHELPRRAAVQQYLKREWATYLESLYGEEA